ncbi:unnamed protein product [Phytophthora lilii]|uniref:Unnamed protein product n=1 Tax=Phytophthora lilii TaxID=2077276 RepID=A0A9W6XE30_9STRA|nr:unnamed protein product [Phytophthora lilii]
MIATAGGWSIGDYAGTLSEDRQLLRFDLFAFAEGYHPRSGREITIVRRVSLTLTREQELSITELLNGVESSKDSTMLDSGIVYGSALHAASSSEAISVSRHELLPTSSTDRAAICSLLPWIPLLEFQAEYASKQRTRGDYALTDVRSSADLDASSSSHIFGNSFFLRNHLQVTYLHRAQFYIWADIAQIQHHINKSNVT